MSNPWIRFFKKHKVAVYYLIICALSASFILGAISFKGKSGTKEYFSVGTPSDIVDVNAFQANGSLCDSQFNITSEKLTINTEPAAFEVYIYTPQRVLDSRPDSVFLKLGVSGGSEDFTYTIRVEKAAYNEAGFTYVSGHNFVFKSNFHGSPFALDLWIYDLKEIEREGNPSNDRIRIYRSDHDAKPIHIGELNHVVIEDLAFVKEEAGREPARPFLIEYPFIVLVLYILLALYVLPIILIKLKKPSKLHYIIIIGFLLRILIAPITSYAFDVRIWKYAGRKFYEDGEITLFTNWSLPPSWYFTIIAFYLPYMLLRNLGLQDIRIYYQPVSSIELTFIKLPLMLSDILTAFLIYKICQERNLDDKWSKAAAAAYLFNPFSIYISSVWPMLDSLAVSFAVLGLYLTIKRRFYLSSLVWGIAVKWYTLGFIPILSIFAYFQSKEKSFLLKLAKSATIGLIGFGFFAFQVLLPFLMHGDLTYLNQIMSFRLKTGGEASLVNFEGVSFWALFQYMGIIQPINNFFLLTFLLFYCILLGMFFFRLKKLALHEGDTFAVFNNALVVVLFTFYLTYPQVTPQTILWILPHLVLGYYLFNEVNALPIAVVVLSVLSILGDISYYTIGFSVANIAFAGTPINYLSYLISASFIPIALWFFLKVLSPGLHSKATRFSRRLLHPLHPKNLFVLYLASSIFILMQAVLIYTLDLKLVSLFPLLILTILLQCIVFFGIARGIEFRRLGLSHKVKECMR